MRRRPAGLLLLALLLVFETSCGSVQAISGLGGTRAKREQGTAGSERLLVRRASLEVAVEDLAAATEEAEAATLAMGGFVESSRIDADGPSRLTLRIPDDRLEEGLDRLAALGEERARRLSAKDVTEEAADLEARLRNARALRDRLRALLKRAQKVEEILSIEKELARVQTEVESMEGRLERLRGDVAQARVDLELWRSQREILGPLGYAFAGLSWIVEKLFVIRPGSP